MPRAAFAVAAIASAAVPGAAFGQLVPERQYYGVNRPIPMSVTVPSAGEGEVEIALFDPAAPGSAAEATGAPAAPREKAAAAAGRVDLAGLFPVLWTSTDPKVVYAQLLVGGKKVGAPVVLRPLLNPDFAREPGQGQVQWAPSRESQTYSGIRADVDQRIVLETSLGEIELSLRPDMAPNTCASFMDLVRGGFYTDVVFHRIVPMLPDGHAFVIQGGDPAGKGTGGPGFTIDLERSTLPHDFGVISMARTGFPDPAAPNTNGSQFFLCLSREGTARLDGKYTAFGHTVRGADVIQAIASTPLADAASGKPVTPPVIKSAKLVPAPPFGEGPGPVKKTDASNPQR